MSIKKICWYFGQKFLVSSFISAVLRVFLIFNMAAEGERENIVAHSRITWLICARRVQIYLILFKMAAKLKSERTWVRDLETRKKNPTCTNPLAGNFKFLKKENTLFSQCLCIYAPINSKLQHPWQILGIWPSLVPGEWGIWPSPEWSLTSLYGNVLVR